MVAIRSRNMPRWTGRPKHLYSTRELLYMREYNRAYRQMLRGGRPSMPHVKRGKLGAAVRWANQRKREARESKGKKVSQ